MVNLRHPRDRLVNSLRPKISLADLTSTVKTIFASKSKNKAGAVIYFNGAKLRPFSAGNGAGEACAWVKGRSSRGFGDETPEYDAARARGRRSIDLNNVLADLAER